MIMVEMETMEQAKSNKKSAEEQQRTAKRKEIEAQVIHWLIRNGLFLQRELSHSCQQHALNANQFSALNEIILQGPISQKELCERLLFEKSNVSKIVKNLQEKDLISVTVGPNDRRITLLIETAKGEEVWRECLHKLYGSSTELMSGLSEEELRNTLRLMKILARKFMRLAEKEGR